MIDTADIYLAKAEESFSGAESELVNGRYNNCANRCYYASFQAAIQALVQAGIQPGGGREHWGHDFVQAVFIGQLINRRKMYPSDLREVLLRNYALRETADYKLAQVTRVEASRAVRRTGTFLDVIRSGGDDEP